MIENNRFTYEDHKVKDNLTDEFHSSNMVSVNVLNQLNDDNMMLRRNIEKLSADVDYLIRLPSEHGELYKQCEAKRVDLLEENKQLRQLLRETVNRLEVEISEDHSLYRVSIMIDGKMYLKIKEILHE